MENIDILNIQTTVTILIDLSVSFKEITSLLSKDKNLLDKTGYINSLLKEDPLEINSNCIITHKGYLITLYTKDLNSFKIIRLFHLNKAKIQLIKPQIIS
jgi:hypothetical protein